LDWNSTLQSNGKNPFCQLWIKHASKAVFSFYQDISRSLTSFSSWLENIMVARYEMRFLFNYFSNFLTVKSTRDNLVNWV
jgi:hypothetical protein